MHPNTDLINNTLPPAPKPYKGVTYYMLPYNYGNLPLPFIRGNFNGNFAHYYDKSLS